MISIFTSEVIVKRPTISLCLIAKNEAHNVGRLFKSIEGCFDEICFVDTGSTDNTIKEAQDWAHKINTPIKIDHFEWVNDFSRARNVSFSLASKDFIMWMDLDDILVNKENFINFRDSAMEHADYWLAKYDYAQDQEGKSLCDHARERVFRNYRGFQCRYFVHEGTPPIPRDGKGVRTDYITTWHVKHQRSIDDATADKSRNLKIFEANLNNLDTRMTFYYGKELFENKMFLEAYEWLKKALDREDLEPHDRLLGFQYICFSLLELGQYDKVRQFGLLGVALDPNSAEIHCLIADSYVKQGRLKDAIPHYAAAKSCKAILPGSAYAGANFKYGDTYTTYCRNQLVKCLFHSGEMHEAYKEAKECFELYKHPETQTILADVAKAIDITFEGKKTAKECEDIVILGTPQGAYPWTESLYKKQGMGGSETAAIEMGKWLKKLTGRNVKIFNCIQTGEVGESGVEYIPSSHAPQWLAENKPKVCINWRHNVRMTEAPTYLWCHDLFTGGVEVQQNFDKMLCLTPFHKKYVMGRQGVTENKIIVTRNGVDPSKFGKNVTYKDENKVVWVSSPDRGLDRAMKVMDIAIKDFPDLKLHVFYGIEKLPQFGLQDLHDKLKSMMAERPWVIYHGFTEQNKMTEMVRDAAVWLHPCDFIETFCISAIEMLCSGVYPITRSLGALEDVLGPAQKAGMASLIEHDCVEPHEFQAYADELKRVLVEKKWKNVSVDPEKYSWESIAREWIDIMGL